MLLKVMPELRLCRPVKYYRSKEGKYDPIKCIQATLGLDDSRWEGG